MYEWNRNDREPLMIYYVVVLGSGTEMIFSQNLFRCPTPTCTFLLADFPSTSMLGPRQLALSVEIGNPISLCWGPAGKVD